MRYHPFILYLVAASFCFATHRTDEKSCSTHGEQYISTNIFHVLKIYEDHGRLIEDTKNCAQFLDVFSTLAAETNNSSFTLPDLVKACERVIIVMGRALEESLQRYAQSQIDQFPISPKQLYPGRSPASQTTAIDFGAEGGPAHEYEKSILDLVKRRSKRKHRREEVCEAKVCENEDLGRMCNSKKVEPDAALICKMCYPEKDVELINAHCQAKWKRERRAFYIVSFVLIAVTIISGLLLYIRRRYLREKNPPRDGFQDNGPVEEINPPGEIYYYDGTRLDMTMMPGERGPPSAVNSSPDARQKDGSKRYNIPWDYYEDDMISTSAAQRRLKQLGLLSRTGRKKIHDLFDLEALRSKYDATKGIQRQSNDSDRVPVMPWAPNASVRLSDRETQRGRANAFSRGLSAVELRDMPPKTDAV
ncbi:hypothetical protein UA08_04592 [Talaromyces atroroseus]|uniref:Uncharacterized protein n=1 Tax=Talaromyces atroroseus TaxID=1441469 RepID=A0A225AXU1_TALAT|nr:hypothetical protein UA08_04592 [Talaromyces atroroseus]OKL59796.1 hypothetical protein UA08_04592 [Talaromyces atroroseus]